MKKNIFLLFALFFVVISCNKLEVYNQFDDRFAENRWQENDVKTYDFTIDDDSKLYNITSRS